MKDTKLWAINQHFPIYSNIFNEKVEEYASLVNNEINVSRGTNYVIVRNKAWKPIIPLIQNGDVGYAADEAFFARNQLQYTVS